LIVIPKAEVVAPELVAAKPMFTVAGAAETVYVNVVVDAGVLDRDAPMLVPFA
jgi:hypothetical protein